MVHYHGEGSMYLRCLDYLYQPFLQYFEYFEVEFLINVLLRWHELLIIAPLLSKKANYHLFDFGFCFLAFFGFTTPANRHCWLCRFVSGSYWKNQLSSPVITQSRKVSSCSTCLSKFCVLLLSIAVHFRNTHFIHLTWKMWHTNTSIHKGSIVD